MMFGLLAARRYSAAKKIEHTELPPGVTTQITAAFVM